jgi:hypothetical protein
MNKSSFRIPQMSFGIAMCDLRSSILYFCRREREGHGKVSQASRDELPEHESARCVVTSEA